MPKSTSAFDKLFDKATSHLLLEPDWSDNLTICDMIRQGDVPAKHAVSCARKRLHHDNPHVVVLVLNLLEAMVKNCGGPVHDEVGQLSLMQEFRELIVQAPELVRDKLLQLLQTWAFAFRHSPRYSAVQDTVTVMKAEGYQFPALRESDAMFVAETAPAWADGDECHRCRDNFTTFTRKHHCRACGQVFCSRCSSKNSNIPKFGIEREVRVCDPCFDQINKPTGSAPVKSSTSPATVSSASSAPSGESDLPAEYLASPLSKQSQAPPKRSDAEIKEQEELNLALAISQSEADAKQRQRQRAPVSSSSHSSATSTRHHDKASADGKLKSALKSRVGDSTGPSTERDPEANPELARYLNRAYWESLQQQQQHAACDDNTATSSSSASYAPIRTSADYTGATSSTIAPSQQQQQQQADYSSSINNSNINNNNKPGSISHDNDGEECDDAEEAQLDAFVPAICSQLEIFVNRIKSNSSRGRSIAIDTSVQSMFVNITTLHAQLLRHLQAQEDRRVHYETLQDQLVQVRDARAALTALRDEHAEQDRLRAAAEQQRRQQQMMYKLEMMRHKKQEYLQYQRQMAMQRMQEQEQEMARRHNKQQQQQQYVWSPQHQQQQQQQPPHNTVNYQPMWQPPPMPAPPGGVMVAPGSAASGGHMSTPYNMTGMAASLPAGVEYAVPPGAMYPPQMPAAVATVLPPGDQMVPIQQQLAAPQPPPHTVTPTTSAEGGAAAAGAVETAALISFD